VRVGERVGLGFGLKFNLLLVFPECSVIYLGNFHFFEEKTKREKILNEG
jgi:hypothetical protein